MITNNWLRVTAWAAGLVAAAAFMYIISVLYKPLIAPVLSILLPFSIAVALALLLDPTLGRLERKGLPRSASIAITAAIFLSVVAVLAIFIVPAAARQADELARNLPDYYQRSEQYLQDFTESHQGLLRRFHLPTSAQDMTAVITERVQTFVRDSFSRVGSWLGGLIGKAVWLVLIPIITLFLLADIDRIKGKSLLLVPSRHRDLTRELAGSVGQVFGAYIRGLLSVAFLYGIVCGAALAILGVPYAVLLGAVAGALSLVPYIGTITTLLIIALVAFVSNPGHALFTLWVAITILIINQVFDNVVTPRIVGKAVGLHPALAILALLVGGQLFGLIGMILSVPIAASIQMLILEFYPPLRGPEREVPPSGPTILQRILRRWSRRRELEEDATSR